MKLKLPIFYVEQGMVAALDTKPKDRDFCVTFHKETKEPDIDYFYEEDYDLYVYKPMKLIGVGWENDRNFPRIPLDNIIGKPLEDYIRQKHTQEECSGFIDGWNARGGIIITDIDIEKIAMDELKSKWSHLYIGGYPQRPFPTNYENDLNMVMIGYHKGKGGFTEADIRAAIQFGKDIRSEKSYIVPNYGSSYIEYEDATTETEAYIESLKQPRKYVAIEVETEGYIPVEGYVNSVKPKVENGFLVVTNYIYE